MRKIHLLGATILALSTGAWSMGALAQPAPATAPTAPAAAPAPEAAPAPAAPDSSAPAATTPDSSAPAAKTTTKKHMTHHAMHGKGKLVATKAGDKAVDDLNSASLDSAKSGKPFTAPTTPAAATKEAHAGDTGASTKHHHMMHKTMKKKSSSSDSAAAPATPDATATPPADTSGK